MDSSSDSGFVQERIEPEDIGQFKRISIPLVRRIYPQLIANKIVSVQPLSEPTGLKYYMRFRYSSQGKAGVIEERFEEGEKKPFQNQVTIEEIDKCPSGNTTSTT